MIKSILKKVILLVVLISIFSINHINVVSYASSENIDSVIRGTRNFIEEGENQTSIDEGELKNTSNFLYNLLLGAGMIVAVIVGIILGIKYMIGSVEEKAEYKESLLAYAIGCVVIFGAFGIWKLVVNILKSV